ncbi:MAG TPA: carboxypeptidase regulatory-like domain-containing protein [Anaeromyxobacteraceae bacterium]|nr:carboxypeptidase regulatory-like domain-containing protein [Anaeromyxobacteraceae bacterium]
MRRRGIVLGLAAAALAALLAFLALRPEGRDGRGDDGRAPAPAAEGTPAPRPPPSGLPIQIPRPAPLAPDERPASFEGQVVAVDDGRGVSFAELTFSRAGAAASLQAGPDGAFRFEPPAEGLWLLAAVTAPGFLPFAPEWGHSPVQLDARRGQHVSGVRIFLSRALALEGRVVDPEGAPVAGAEVRLLGATGEAALVPLPSRFVTDPRGAFAFSAPEGAVLEARKPGFLPGRAAVDVPATLERRVTVTLGVAHRPLGSPAPVSGRVVSRGGGPVEGALVVAGREQAFGSGGPSEAQALSGSDGRFALPPLDPGRYRVTARAEGYAPASARRVAPGASDLVLVLEPGSRLAGCVRDASSGASVAPFTVMVWERSGPLRRVLQRSLSVLDPSGCYAVGDLAAGPAAVVVSAPGYAPSAEIAVEIPPAPAEGRADAALQAGGRLLGVVRDETTGSPLAGARVSVEGALEAAASTFPVLAEATSGADGRFLLEGLPTRFSIQVAAAGHHARVLGGIEVGPGETRGPVEIALRPVAEGESPRVDLVGVGMVLAPLGEGLAVVQVLPGGGAAEAGLVQGDLVLRVDGVPVADLGFGGAIDAIRGPEGTRVSLGVRRGERTFEVSAVRRLVRG